MSFTKNTWVYEGATGATAINPTNLNRIETGIDDCHTASYSTATTATVATIHLPTTNIERSELDITIYGNTSAVTGGFNHTAPQTITVDGKNLMDNDTTYEWGYWVSGTPATVTADPTNIYRAPAKVYLTTGTYTISSSKAIAVGIRRYSDGSTPFGVTSDAPRTFAVVAADYYCFTFRNTASTTWLFGTKPSEDSIQIELASTATTYEAYKVTTATTPVNLLSVTNIADYFNVKTGVYNKRVDIDDTVNSTQYDSLTTGTNADIVKTTAFSLSVAGTTGAADGFIRVFNSSGVELSEITNTAIDVASSVGKYYYHTDKTVWFIVTADSYADIAAARTGLGTSVVIYKLATPTTTNYDPQILQSDNNSRIRITATATSTTPTSVYRYAKTVKGQSNSNSDQIKSLNKNLIDYKDGHDVISFTIDDLSTDITYNTAGNISTVDEDIDSVMRKRTTISYDGSDLVTSVTVTIYQKDGATTKTSYTDTITYTSGSITNVTRTVI